MQDFVRNDQKKLGNLERSKYPAYHMWLSTRDLARIGHLMLNKGNWGDRQIVPKDWCEQIVSLVTPASEMNPERIKNGTFGYGYMWWVWDDPEADQRFEGAYTARGAWGQYITVIPSLDMVVAMKTNDIYRRRTGWDEYYGLLKRLVESKIKE